MKKKTWLKRSKHTKQNVKNMKKWEMQKYEKKCNIENTCKIIKKNL